MRPDDRLSFCISLSLLLLAVSWSFVSAAPRTLTFEDRVRAQEAIERVYYSHQIGATKSFEEAVPREFLEKKVRTYLKQSAALEELWNTRETEAALAAELARIVRSTRFPSRLTEIYDSLDHDRFLILECFARPLLVDRLSRNFFTFDSRIHAARRTEAEQVRAELKEGRGGAASAHHSRVVLSVQSAPDAREEKGEQEFEQPAVINGGEGNHRVVLGRRDFSELRARTSIHVGEIGPVIEEREAFVVRDLLEESAEGFRFAEYRVAKLPWDDWWHDMAPRLEEGKVAAVGLSSRELPEPLWHSGSRWSYGMTQTEDIADAGTGLPPGCPEGTWMPTSNAYVAEERYAHAAVWTGNVMVVWGGNSNTGARYDPLTDIWSRTSTTNAPTTRILPTAVWTGSLMVVWGGSDSLATGGRYDPVSDTWTPTSTTNAPSGRGRHTAVWTGTLMVVWGGVNGSILNTGGRYDPVSDTWMPISLTNAPAERYVHTAVWTGSVMVVWGGANSSVLDTGGRYDPVTDIWSLTSTTNAPTARDSHTAIWTGSVMVVWGGNGASHFLNTGGRYDPVSDVWIPTSISNAPMGQAGHTGIWTGNLMVVWGGVSGPSSYTNTGGRYDPATDTWTRTSTTNAPAGRYLHTAIWSGSLMVVWGGYDGNAGGAPMNSGGRYTPLTDTWTPTETDAPTERRDHSAIWTGSLMVVWGGSAAGPTYLNTGGRYDPLTDTWTPASTLNAPTGRYLHSAIWTGGLMVVWGGFDGNRYLNTGGLYDPVNDTWTPTSTVNAPAGRYTHTAIWTGDLMVVWGGYPGSPYLNTGGRYDPVRDDWTPTSTGDAPTARSLHSAVWTGSVMIVWGGQANSSGTINTGGRYDPSTDTWSPTSISGAPSATSGSTAVWTGSQLIVWGGSNLNTGGRYEPLTDTWTPTSTANAPAGRSAHTALWAGSVMVVWGGSDGTDLNTGGRYAPVTDTWTPTTTVNAPVGRFHHTAIWTGDVMIVWGGDTSSGGQYGSFQSVDGDHDGFDECAGDCDDTSAAIHPGATETCNNIDENCDGQVDEGLGSTTCGVGACQRTVQICMAGAMRTCTPGTPSSEICDGVDNNCNGSMDDGISSIPTTCGVGVCTANGQMTCQGGQMFDSCVPEAPRVEVCDGLDDDCNDLADDVVGGCTLFVTDPLNHDVLDCTSPKTSQPTITWHPAQFDRFAVLINTDAAFKTSKGISGDTITMTSWKVPRTKWVDLCKRVANGGTLFIKIQGIDVNVRVRDPQRKFFCPVVTTSVRK